jgi:hypothetical protein
VDDCVDGAERVDRLGEEPLDVQLVIDAGADGHGGTFLGQNRIDGRVRRSLVVGVVDGHGVAQAREPDKRLPAHASRPAGDDRDTICRQAA